MKIEKTWSASSESGDLREGEELTNIAGRWGIGVEVSVTRPYTYSKGPVEKRIIRRKESPPSPIKE